MTERNIARGACDPQLAAFLRLAGIAEADLQVLTSGLSAKRFYRVAGRNLVVLDARTVVGLTERYAAIAHAISDHGSLVPKVHFVDHVCGFALVEYLGDRPLAQVIDQAIDKRSWFLTATRALAALHGLKPPDTVPVPRMSAERIAAEVQMFGQIASAKLGIGDLDSATFLREYQNIWKELSEIFPAHQQLVLGDFEPENLMVVEISHSIHVGILDFDEAFTGDHTYDLACLVESARRKTEKSIIVDCINLYSNITGQDVREITRRVSLWSVQRHLRILGIFLDTNKIPLGRFDRYIPNLMDCVRRNLQIEEFSSLRYLMVRSGILSRG